MVSVTRTPSIPLSSGGTVLALAAIAATVFVAVSSSTPIDTAVIAGVGMTVAMIASLGTVYTAAICIRSALLCRPFLCQYTTTIAITIARFLTMASDDDLSIPHCWLPAGLARFRVKGAPSFTAGADAGASAGAGIGARYDVMIAIDAVDGR